MKILFGVACKNNSERFTIISLSPLHKVNEATEKYEELRSNQLAGKYAEPLEYKL